jgi:hypothetical protein
MAKRRADGDGSITWDASVQLWVGRLPRDDRGRRAKVSAKTKAEARAKLQQRLRERELGLSTDAGRTTVKQFLEAWIREIVEPGDLASMTTGLRADRPPSPRPRLGRIKLAKLTPMHIQRFIKDELAAGRDAERCSCPTRCCGSRSDRP